MHNVLLYCLQVSSKLFIDISGDTGLSNSLFLNLEAIFYLVARFYVKAIFGVG